MRPATALRTILYTKGIGIMDLWDIVCGTACFIYLSQKARSPKWNSRQIHSSQAGRHSIRMELAGIPNPEFLG